MLSISVLECINCRDPEGEGEAEIDRCLRGPLAFNALGKALDEQGSHRVLRLIHVYSILKITLE